MNAEGLCVEGLERNGVLWVGGGRLSIAVPVELGGTLDRLAGFREHSQSLV